MLVVYHGHDIPKRKQALKALRESLSKKRPDAEHFEMDQDDFAASRLEELAASRGLFEDKYIVYLFHVLADKAHAETVIELAESMAQADHVFVIIADELEKKHKKTLEDYAETTKYFPAERKSEDKKPWPLTDAYGNRQKKQAWIKLQEALKSPNNTPESIQGLLWWQTKLIWLAKQTSSAKEAGESGYPYKKAKKFAGNFSDDELYKKTTQLTTMYHEAHRGKCDLADALEQFVLEI